MLEPVDTPTRKRSALIQGRRVSEPSSCASVEELCDWLDERIRGGEHWRAESLLVQFPEWFSDTEAALDLIYTEYHARSESASPPCPEEFYQRFPQWRTQLQHQFELSDIFHQTESKQSDGEASNSMPVGPRYRVIKLLARGGIGQIMQAVDTELNREVAIKEIQKQLSNNLSVRERFLREAEITGQLEHPGIVPVYGLGSDENHLPFYAMRLVRGQSLFDAIQEFHSSAGTDAFRSLRFQNLLRRFLSVCETISYAHSRGVIHRDIKPENILLGPFGETLVVDWGLAKISQPSTCPASNPQEDTKPAEPATSPTSLPVVHDQLVSTSGQFVSTSGHSPANWSVELTQSAGALVGTPGYMSPEQARGGSADITPLSDVYSLGATLHMLLTGQPRLESGDLGTVLRTILNGDWKSPRVLNRKVPSGLDAICMKAMRLTPAERYASAAELAEDIEHYLADEPTSALRESALGPVMRLTRRHRSLAFSAVVSMMILTIITLMAAMRIDVSRRRADTAFITAERGNARLAFDRAYELLESHQFGEGWLWLQRALMHVPKDDHPMRRVILTNMAAARSHILYRHAIFDNQQSLAAFQFDPEGRQLLTVGREGAVRYWDADNGQLLAEHKLLATRYLAAYVDADFNGRVVAMQGRLLTVFATSHAQSPEVLWTAEQPAEIHQVVIKNDGTEAAISVRSDDRWSIRILDLETGHTRAEVACSTPAQILFNEPHRQVICVDERMVAHLFQSDKEGKNYRLTGTLKNVFRMTASPNGRWLMVGTAQGSVHCYAANTLELHSDVGKHLGSVASLAVSPDGQILVAAWENGMTRSWNLQDRQPACENLKVDRYTGRMLFRPHTRQLALLAKPHLLNVWQLPSSNQPSLPTPLRAPDAIEYSRDGAFAIGTTRYRYAQLIDGSTGAAIGAPLEHQDVIKSVCLHPLGQLALTSSFDGTCVLWNTLDGRHASIQLRESESSGPYKANGKVNFATFSPDGLLIATAENNGSIKLWDAVSGLLLRTMSAKGTSPLKICFSPSSRQLLAGYNAPNSGVRMWNVATGEQMWSGEHGAAVRCVAISPDGRYAVSGANDYIARLWDAHSGELLASELPGRGEIFVARFHPNSSLVATAGYDATIRLWRVPSGEPIGEPMVHEALVTDLAFDASGARLISASVDQTARLWDVDTCLPLSPPYLHSGPIYSVAFHPHAELALTGRLCQLPRPLPDQPELIRLLTQLATQRTFSAGNNIDWLTIDELNKVKKDFQSKSGMAWQEWP